MQTYLDEEFLSSSIINREKFTELREYLRETRLQNPHKSLEESKDYAFACSSLAKLIPSIEADAASNMYHQINYYKGLTWIQQRNIIDSFDYVQEGGDMGFLSSIDKPRIYCTFHIGSYRMSLFKILEKGIDLAIVLASNTLKQQHESLTIAHEELKRKTGLTNTLSFIDAESAAGAIQMVRALKEGKSLFFYIDGNTGVGGIKRNDDKMIDINFFGLKLFARKGVAYIANKCKVPIIMTLCCYVSDDEMKINYYPPINPLSNNTDPNESAKILTQDIYDSFSEVLKKYPSQWEGWFSIPNFVDNQQLSLKHKNTSTIEKDKKYIYNKDKFYCFNYMGTTCIMNKETFMIYPISPELLNILKIDDHFIYQKNTLPEEVFEFLVKNEMLTAS